MTAAGSPGARRVMKKTMVATSSITITMPAKREARYRVMECLRAARSGIRARGGPSRSGRGAAQDSINANVQASLVQPRVPEKWPWHRHVTLELRRARGHAVEITDANVRYLGEHDRLHVTPQCAALVRVGFGVERGQRRFFCRRAPPAWRAIA